MREWEKLPKELRNARVRKYYSLLKKKRMSLFIKRMLDLIFGVVLLVFFSPIFLILAVVIKIDSKGPVFYRQERVTIYNRTFKIFKFRTMVQNADKIGPLATVENDKRVTRVGRIIRKVRLDEIPQLINIIAGDMSFVGTRPEVRKYVDAYNDEMKATLLMRAGVTSYASIVFKDEDQIIKKYVNKNHDVDDVYVDKILPLKMQINLKYLRDFSVLTDFKICVLTVISVLRPKKRIKTISGVKNEI
ncbi:sugar transferase [Candidatus Saccharibacteria bacterium]|nr:sugar transferase [Candidatus Saccharibacteria bacterium]